MRRRLEISEREPPKIRSSSFTRFSGVRNYEEPKDSNREKRVKFSDPQIDASPCINPHYIRSRASPVQKKSGASVSNAPKTSEYAFFKKLKNNSGHDLSNRLHKEKKQSKNMEPEESDDTLKYRYPELESSRLVEKARQNHFLSPQANLSKNSEVTDIFRNSYEESRFPLATEKDRPIKYIPLRSSPGGKLEDVGTTYLDEDIFSSKRKKLRQWAVQTMMPQVDGSHPERFCLVSLLLNRLFPNNEENNSSRDAKPIQTKEDSSNLIDSSPEPDAVRDKFHSKHKRNFTEAGNEWCRKDTCKASREMIHPKLDTEDFDSPLTSYSAEYFQYHDKTYFPAYEDNNMTSIAAARDPFLIDFEQYGHEPSYIEEPNEFQVLNESTSKGGPINPLSNWDVGYLEKRSASFFTSNEMNLHTWTAFEDKNHKNLSDKFDVGESCTSSFFSSYSFRVNSFSLPYSYVPNHYDEERSLEEERSPAAELENVPLSLSCIPPYRSTWKDFTHSLCEDISIFSPENNRWLINKTFNDEHHSDFGVLVPSGQGCGFGFKCLPDIGSCDELCSDTYDAILPLQNDGSCLKLLTDGKEDFLDCSSNREIVAYQAGNADDCHEWSSIDLHRPLDMVVNCPLLLGSSSWQRSEEDREFDD